MKLKSILKDIFNSSLIKENFFSVKDTKQQFPLTNFIFNKISDKLPGLSIKNNPELEASGAEGIVISLDDYKVVKLFFDITNASKITPLMDKNFGFTANIISAGTIKLNEPVKYIKKGSIYTAQDAKDINTIYYVVMERIVPDTKTYNNLEVAYKKYTNIQFIPNIETVRKHINTIKTLNSKELIDNIKNNIFKPFLSSLEDNFGVTPDILYNTNFNPDNLSKKQKNLLIQEFLKWKKSQKSSFFIFNNKPLLLKFLLLSYIGKKDLGYDITELTKEFFNSLKGNNKENFNEIVALLKDILIKNKIDWQDIHKEQFGRKGKEQKLVAIDIGVKSDSRNAVNAFNKNKQTVDIKSKVRQSVSENSSTLQTTELNFFDFDNTLFLTPSREKGVAMYKKITGEDYPYEGWAGKAESLLPEYNIQLNPEIIPYLKKALSNPNAKNFLLTDRNFKLREAVLKILNTKKIKFDGYLLKSGNSSKTDRIEQAFKESPTATVINVYDDMEHQLNMINNNFKEKYNIYYPELKINLVKINKMNEYSNLKLKNLLPYVNEANFNNIQSIIDGNQFVKGTANEESIIETSKYILFISPEGLKHIKERHSDKSKPGSIITGDLKDIITKTIQKSPSESSGGRVKWLDVKVGNVGEMGVAKATPEEVSGMTDYTMPDGRKETVKIKQGQRPKTDVFNVITAEIGEDSGKPVLSIITAFPGPNSIDGVEMPMDRNEFAEKGFYFIVNKKLDENIKHSKEILRMRKLAGIK